MTTDEFRKAWKANVAEYHKLKMQKNLQQQKDFRDCKRSLFAMQDEWKEIDAKRRRGELVDTDRVNPVIGELGAQVKALGLPVKLIGAELYTGSGFESKRWGAVASFSGDAITNEKWMRILDRLHESIETFDHIDLDRSRPLLLLADKFIDWEESAEWPDKEGRIPCMAWAIVVNDWRPDFSEVNF